MILVSEWHEDCLERYLKSSKFSSFSSLAGLARQLLSALAYLEGEGITHRGLSPSNILITPEVRPILHDSNHAAIFLAIAGRHKALQLWSLLLDRARNSGQFSCWVSANEIGTIVMLPLPPHLPHLFSSPRYLAPEVIISGPGNVEASGPKVGSGLV